MIIDSITSCCRKSRGPHAGSSASASSYETSLHQASSAGWVRDWWKHCTIIVLVIHLKRCAAADPVALFPYVLINA